MDDTMINKLACLLAESERTVFFGGAGVSTESGVKDYRSSDGLYNTVKEYGVSPETILSAGFFREHTDVFYDFYYKYFLRERVQPNKAHTALARLEREGMLSCVITQNIDGLHQAAGSKNVLELHGSASKHYCTKCGENAPLSDVERLRGGVPRCSKCGGVLKPRVTLYGEQLDDTVTGRAVKEISRADLLIIGGTSLSVYPAAAYIGYFKGENTVLINRDETDYDKYSSLVFHESIGDVLDSAVSGAVRLKKKQLP